MARPAPLFLDIADAPATGRAFRVTTHDGLAIRAAVWEGDGKGTVLILPGRSEYIEKYGRVVASLTQRGYACVVIDWRGQGLSDRLTEDPFIGHVGSFADYQVDLETVLAAPEVTALPGPRWMLAHSMGGCIGYRALLDGLEVSGAIFSAPMWGIQMAPGRQPIARILATIIPKISSGPNYAPGGDATPYLDIAAFDDNVLTADHEHFNWLRHHLTAHPELGLGGPSYTWLGAALKEMALLHAAKPVETPMLILLGSDEQVVSSHAIRLMARRLPNAHLEMLPEARHEVLVETEAVRAHIWPLIDDFLDRA